MRLLTKQLLIIIFSLSTFMPFMSHANTENVDDIIWIAHDYPPYNFLDANGKAVGIAVDTMQSILVQAGSKKTAEDIQVLPWARAYNELQTNKNYSLLSTSRTAERENLFKWAGPLAPSKVVLFAKKSRHFKINSINDIKEYTVGAVNGAAPQRLLLATYPEAKIEVTTNLSQSVEKLQNDHIDMVVADEKVLMYLVTKLNFDNNDYEVIYNVQNVDYYLAFNKETSDELVSAFQKAIDALYKK